MDMRFLPLFMAVIAGGLFFMACSIYRDVSDAGAPPQTPPPFLLPGLAMLIALGFEFANSFPGTANAVATVIYTHTLPRRSSWSGRAAGTSSACWRRPARWRSRC